jgi:glyoxylase-like metal-dependent hydrolase (beta-lactamase superfamily II)
LWVWGGAANGNLAPALQRTVHRWLIRNGRAKIPLVVIHTHGHEDHIAGDQGSAALHDPQIPISVIAADKAYEETNGRQIKRMWDQNAP